MTAYFEMKTPNRVGKCRYRCIYGGKATTTTTRHYIPRDLSIIAREMMPTSLQFTYSLTARSDERVCAMRRRRIISRPLVITTKHVMCVKEEGWSFHELETSSGITKVESGLWIHKFKIGFFGATLCCDLWCPTRFVLCPLRTSENSWDSDYLFQFQCFHCQGRCIRFAVGTQQLSAIFQNPRKIVCMHR